MKYPPVLRLPLRSINLLSIRVVICRSIVLIGLPSSRKLTSFALMPGFSLITFKRDFNPSFNPSFIPSFFSAISGVIFAAIFFALGLILRVTIKYVRSSSVSKFGGGDPLFLSARRIFGNPVHRPSANSSSFRESPNRLLRYRRGVTIGSLILSLPSGGKGPG